MDRHTPNLANSGRIGVSQDIRLAFVLLEDVGEDFVHEEAESVVLVRVIPIELVEVAVLHMEPVTGVADRRVRPERIGIAAFYQVTMSTVVVPGHIHQQGVEVGS